MIGNAYITPVWLRRWQEGYQVIHATFRNVLKLMSKFSELIFTCSSAVLYELDPYSTYHYIDQGWQDLTFILLSHKDSWRKTCVVKLAEEIIFKPVVIVDHLHGGVLRPYGSFIEVSKKNMIVSVLKKHEDSDDLILRCYETSKEETEIEIPFLNRSWKTSFKPCEIKTFIISRRPDLKVVERDMLEFVKSSSRISRIGGLSES